MDYLKIYYPKYKKYLVPAILVLISLFIILAIIFPQFSEIGKLNKSISDKKMEIVDLNNTLNILIPMSEVDTKSDLSLAAKALPSAKDISLMFLALSSSASVADVELAGFSLKVGGVYTDASKAGPTVPGFPTLAMNVVIKSESPSKIINFISQLHERLPLSEVGKFEIVSDVANFDVNFYYKPYDLTAISTQKVAPMSENEKKLIEQLRSWDK